MNILVTGHSGNIGSKLFQYLKSFYDENSIFALTNIKINNDDNLFCCDLRDKEKLDIIFQNNFDVVIHCAAKTNLQTKTSEDDYLNNILSTTNILSLAIKNKVDKFIFLSSFMVYGKEYEITNLLQSTRTKPFEWYSKSKSVCEKILLDNQHSIKISILRLPEVIDADCYNKGLIFDMCESLKAHKLIEIYKSGDYYRNFLFIDDLMIFIKNIIDSENNDLIIGPLFTDEAITLQNLANILVSNSDNLSIKINKDKINNNKYINEKFNLLEKRSSSLNDVLKKLSKKLCKDINVK